MAYEISEECLGCGACTVACSVNAIYPEKGIFKIDDKKCTGCGACEELCPIAAISEK